MAHNPARHYSTAKMMAQNAPSDRALPPALSSVMSAMPSANSELPDHEIRQLDALIPMLRDRLVIEQTALSDQDILGSLKAIQARTDPQARWLTAFNSPLGHWLIIRGSDLNTQLSMVISLVHTAQN